MTGREMAKVYCERRGLRVNTATINAYCGGKEEESRRSKVLMMKMTHAFKATSVEECRSIIKEAFDIYTSTGERV